MADGKFIPFVALWRTKRAGMLTGKFEDGWVEALKEAGLRVSECDVVAFENEDTENTKRPVLKLCLAKKRPAKVEDDSW